MTQQRAADRLAVEAMAEAHCVTYHGGHASGPACALGRAEVGRLFRDNPALADAIELGSLLLSDDGPKALAEALSDPILAELQSRFILAALTAKLRERA